MKEKKSTPNEVEQNESTTIKESEPEVRIDRKGRLYVDIDELASSPSFWRQIQTAASINLSGKSKQP